MSAQGGESAPPTTLHGTLRPAPAEPGRAAQAAAGATGGDPSLGWRGLVAAPGEPHSGAAPDPGGRVLLALAHLSDLHLCDAESPARQEYLDHHGDPGAPYAARLGVIGTYRPQEILTVQVAACALTAVGRVGRGPVTGAPLDALLATGDVTDNAQSNELRWYTELMTGRVVSPWSGDPARSSWVGASGTGDWRAYFWHPDGPADGEPADLPTARYGYPRIPGLVEAARRPVRSPGAGLPLLTVHGNHDSLLQGTVAPTPALHALATGTERIVGLSAGQTPLVILEGAAPLGPARYTHDDTAPRIAVAPDPERGLVERPERGWWARDVGEVRVLALDTVNPHGGWQGSVGSEQLAWLETELERAQDRYVVVTSHHPSWTLTNGYAPSGAEPRHLADEVLGLLLRFPSVIAWVAGHVHAHSHLWHAAPGREGGLWEITTSSLIDWPQQLRVLEVVREAGGTVAIASTVVDHSAGPAWGPEAMSDPAGLAAVSRALAANDYRVRGALGHRGSTEGTPADRNAVWRLPDPLR
ncbi:metallophosphoesterase [Actinotalea sp.]|uniref:metallophosphoesterase n=1 Tax=Actinotalea sp. TaxID=1872145 RepID=UPI003563E170